VLVLCVLAAVFGAEDSGAAAAVPLALGGLAVVGLVALAYYSLRHVRLTPPPTPNPDPNPNPSPNPNPNPNPSALRRRTSYP